MSATEWKFVPVEPTEEMRLAFGNQVRTGEYNDGTLVGDLCLGIYSAMLDAAPVPPSVESLLENWTPSDRQAFSRFVNKHFPAEMDSYAIQSLGSAWKDGQANAQPQPAAHLTIPGALEWDGDNGTHGADGESRENGESEGDHEGRQLEWERCENKRLRALLECSQGDMRQADQIMARQRVELDNLEQSRRSFFDLSQDLEKRLAERDAVLNQAYMALIGYLPGHRNDLTDSAISACSATLFPVEAKAACSRCGDWGHIETEDSAHDCPECGPSVVERAVEAGVMNAPKPYAAMSEAEADEFLSSFGGGNGNKAKRRIAALAANAKPESFPCWSCRAPVTAANRADADGNCPHCEAELDLEDWPIAQAAKPKTCIECDQPYCHGVCVERGDQDYDRDQAERGGCDE
jgi:Zn finger protein HypA/HybF involved in hydrogenase expression